MHFISNIKNLCTDFLFPKSQKILEIEAFSASQLLDILPPAESIKSEKIIALFDYRNPLVKDIIWELKYNGNVKIASLLGEIIYDVIKQELADLTLFDKWSKPLLIPVPISDKRRFERGWNQSEILCQQIIKHDSEKILKYVPRQLIKNRHTESQTKTISRNERLKNLTHSMEVLDTTTIKDEGVIIIDDVTTTGSTLAEARRALNKVGIRKILCISVAH